MAEIFNLSSHYHVQWYK